MRFVYNVDEVSSRPLSVRHATADVGVILIHGLNSTPAEMNGLALRLSHEGYSVNSLALRGHAAHPRDLLGVVWTDWIEDTLQAIRNMKESHEKIIVVGQCAGAIIGMFVATRVLVDALYLTAPVMKPNRKAQRLGPLIMALGKQFRTWTPGKDEMEGVDWQGYYTHPISVHMEFIKLQLAMAERLHLVACPTLIIRSKQDRMIPDEEIRRFIACSPAQVELLELEGKAHILTLNKQVKEVVASQILSSLKKRFPSGRGT